MLGYHLRKRDRAFHYGLSHLDAFRHKDFLLRLAGEKYPSAPLTRLIILINYTVVPPTYSLQHVDEYNKEIFYTSAAIKMREHRDLENLQNDRGWLLIESKVSNGISSETFITKVPREFWDHDYVHRGYITR